MELYSIISYNLIVKSVGNPRRHIPGRNTLLNTAFCYAAALAAPVPTADSCRRQPASFSARHVAFIELFKTALDAKIRVFASGP